MDAPQSSRAGIIARASTPTVLVTERLCLRATCIAVFGVLFFVCFAFALTMFLRERAGKPIFQNLEEPKKESTAPKTDDVKVSTQA